MLIINGVKRQKARFILELHPWVPKWKTVKKEMESKERVWLKRRWYEKRSNSTMAFRSFRRL